MISLHRKTQASWAFGRFGDAASWTWTLGDSKPAVGGVVAYSGVDPASPVSVSANAAQTTSTTSHGAASVTTAVANQQLVTLYGVAANTSLTAPSGMTERVDAANPSTQDVVTLEIADKAVPTAGSTGTQTATSAVAGKSANHTIALRPDPGSTTITKTTRYTAGATLDGSNQVIERTVGLPGGVAVTKRASGQVWSYPNLHGDTAAVTDQNGAKQGNTYTYDPFGNSLDGQVPDNLDGSLDAGWTGARNTEHEAGMAPIVEMGARQYDPRLGRFLEVDPVHGGSCSDYDYTCADPVNGQDLSGECYEVLCLIIALEQLAAYLSALWGGPIVTPQYGLYPAPRVFVYDRPDTKPSGWRSRFGDTCVSLGVGACLDVKRYEHRELNITWTDSSAVHVAVVVQSRSVARLTPQVGVRIKGVDLSTSVGDGSIVKGSWKSDSLDVYVEDRSTGQVRHFSPF